MKTRREIKAEARGVLGHALFSNQWLLFLALEFIAALISGVLAYTFVGLIILGGSLSYGLAKAELKAVRKQTESAEISVLFDGFKDDFGGTLVLGLMEMIFLFLWTLLLIIPGIIKSYSYSQAFYIKADDPKKDWNTCITESRKLMNGHKWSLFVQDLSFIGWIIVGYICCGIGTLWVIPYFQASRAIFYNELIGYNDAPAAEATDSIVVDAE